MTYLVAFLVVFAKVGLAVLQQKAVEAERVWQIPPTSLVMQAVECATWGIGVSAFANQDWLAVLAMGLGAGSGSLVALYVNRRWISDAAPKPGTIIPKNGTLRRVK